MHVVVVTKRDTRPLGGVEGDLWLGTTPRHGIWLAARGMGSLVWRGGRWLVTRGQRRTVESPPRKQHYSEKFLYIKTTKKALKRNRGKLHAEEKASFFFSLSVFSLYLFCQICSFSVIFFLKLFLNFFFYFEQWLPVSPWRCLAAAAAAPQASMASLLVRSFSQF